MSNRNGNRLQDLLTPGASDSELRPGTEFWADFQERARALPRSPPSRRVGMPVVIVFAAVLAAVGMVALLVAKSGHRDESGAAVVESLEVEAAHSGVVVIQGGKDDPTIVWILNMSEDEGAGST